MRLSLELQRWLDEMAHILIRCTQSIAHTLKKC